MYSPEIIDKSVKSNQGCVCLCVSACTLMHLFISLEERPWLSLDSQNYNKKVRVILKLLLELLGCVHLVSTVLRVSHMNPYSLSII